MIETTTPRARGSSAIPNNNMPRMQDADLNENRNNNKMYLRGATTLHRKDPDRTTDAVGHLVRLQKTQSGSNVSDQEQLADRLGFPVSITEPSVPSSLFSNLQQRAQRRDLTEKSAGSRARGTLLSSNNATVLDSPSIAESTNTTIAPIIDTNVDTPQAATPALVTNPNTTGTKASEAPAPSTPAAGASTLTPTTEVPVQSWTGCSNVSGIMEDMTKPQNVISELTAEIPEPPDHHPDNPTLDNPKNASPSCNTLSCHGLAVLNDHPLLYIFIFMVVSLLCCVRCKICSRRQGRDPRGEYRAVGRMLATNFDTEIGDEDMDFYQESEYDDDNDEDGNTNGHDNGGWSNYDNKGSIELGSIGADTLTLEEMNG